MRCISSVRPATTPFRGIVTLALVSIAQFGAARTTLAQEKVSGSSDKVPVRQLGPIVAKSAEPIGVGAIVRGTSNGSVIVNSASRQRVYAFDPTLAHFTIVVDSGEGTGVTTVRASGLIPFAGDSTLLADMGSQSLLVITPSGRIARAMAPPNAQDLVFLTTPAAFGRPSFDPKGRLVYRTILRPNMGAGRGPAMTAVMGDSSPILRANIDTRTLDTATWLKTPSPARMSVDQTSEGRIVMKMILNPFLELDEWAMLTDGTIAIVRAHDYHVDFIDPDGTRRSSEKLPFDWRRFSEDEKQAKMDSAKAAIDKQLSAALDQQFQQMPPGMQRPTISIDMAPQSEIPDYWPPIQGGSVQADFDNMLWILPTTSSLAAGGLTYDVVDRTGRLVERVKLPPGRTIAGFGPDGSVYLSHTEGDVTYLERARRR
jgi:hypothetical protein